MQKVRWLAILVAIIILALAVTVPLILSPEEGAPVRPEVVVRTVGHLWSWEFFLDDGSGVVVHTIGEFIVGVGTDVQLVVESADVVHSFYCPALALKIDVVPGLQSIAPFHPVEVGDFQCLNAEFSGMGHDQMVATLHVVAAPVVAG